MGLSTRQMEFWDEEKRRSPFLDGIESDVLSAYSCLADVFSCGGKLLTCGNGGSGADADHVVGELMKGFLRKRPLPADLKERLSAVPEGLDLAAKLQSPLPAISLCAHSALFTAFGNDVDFEMAFAQQVLGYGCPGDALMAISTSGSSRNVILAAVTARAAGMKVIGLTGKNPGRLSELCDVAVRVPETSTWKAQGMHGTVYHILCILVEMKFWP